LYTETNTEFENYCQAIYGERWPMLRESLLTVTKPCAFSAGLKKPYTMDRASIIAAMELRVEGGLIFDACAAPGGKSLVLCSRMGTEAILFSNELSKDRRRRLCTVLDEHLDERRQQVKVTSYDAAKLGANKKYSEHFDAIFLDAPCSSERHVMADKTAYAKWSPGRPRFLSQRQWSLLSSAFLLLKEGGSLVYATCAISTVENDGVAERLLKKYQSQVILDPPQFTEGEKTLYGKIIMPDQCDGMGPMYVARFKKSYR
jgi:16S rRNA (cytosine1407-C5)-methyltransferase